MMNLVNSFIIMTLLMIVGNIQGSSLVASRMDHRMLKVARQKRFLNQDCIFSTSNTVCNFFCENIGSYSVCFNAKLENPFTPESAEVTIEGSVNGLKVFFQRLGRRSDPNPPPVCSVNMCMVLNNVNPDKLSACIQLNDQKTNATLKEVGCFRTTLFGDATKQVVSRETTSTVETNGTTANGTDSGTVTTESSGTLCRIKRSGSNDNGTECTTGLNIVTMDTEPDDQDVNGSRGIGISLMMIILIFTILKLF